MSVTTDSHTVFAPAPVPTYVNGEIPIDMSMGVGAGPECKSVVTDTY